MGMGMLLGSSTSMLGVGSPRCSAGASENVISTILHVRAPILPSGASTRTTLAAGPFPTFKFGTADGGWSSLHALNCFSHGWVPEKLCGGGRGLPDFLGQISFPRFDRAFCNNNLISSCHDNLVV